MPLIKKNLPVPFAQGLDTKSDPYQVQPGKFLSLINSVFTKAGLLQKRNGFRKLSNPATGGAALFPPAAFTTLTTFKNNLLALGNYIAAYSTAISSFILGSRFQTLSLSTLALVRSSTNQSQADSAISSSGLICTVYTDNVTSGSSTLPVYKYVVSDSATGQVLNGPLSIPGTVNFSPRVFANGSYFIIVFGTLIGSIYYLNYCAISTADFTVTNGQISAQYSAAATGTFDGVVAGGNLYLSWNGNDAGGAIRTCYLSASLIQSNTVVTSGISAAYISVTADTTGAHPVIWTTAQSGSSGYSFALDYTLALVLASTLTISDSAVNLASTAQNSKLSIFYEVAATYSWGDPTNYIKGATCTTGAVITATGTISLSVGLASKSFIYGGASYFLTAYSSPYQPTYFLMDQGGNVIAKLADSNGGGYVTTILPSVTVIGNIASVPYLFKDLVQATNKSLNPASNTPVYSQLGVNLANFDFTTRQVVSSEIGNNLHMSGGFPWMYDGNRPVEHNFHLWPDSIHLTDQGGSTGNMSAQQYYYQVTYEWTDSQGNVHRSAPSIPVSVTVAAGSSSVLVKIPTLRLTYKQGVVTPVRLVIYRWSVAQQTFYQTTSIQVPLLNDPTVNSISYGDALADSAIIGNNILYTTGGVAENIAGPATNAITLWKARLWLIDAEDPDLLWYSKPVIETVPVELSDLFTFYVPPTAGAETGTGPNRCLFAMDDKLILFKENALYYLIGDGPDITGANNDYTQPNFITSPVGCINQQSIVFTPEGLMFQASGGAGIWLLGRNLSTSYIGAPVEAFNSATVLSAIQIPNTTQVRFTLSTGVTLMYDYFYGQWGEHKGAPGISSTVFQKLHTYIDVHGSPFQETPGLYTDNGNPVLLSFVTNWYSLATLQGYQRMYFFYLLGTYYSPHKLSVAVAYNYKSGPTQVTLVSPINFSPAWGEISTWGSGAGQAWGGPGDVEQERITLQRQQCQSFQIILNEVFDPTYGTPAGQGLTLSGINLVYGIKKGYRPISAAQTA